MNVTSENSRFKESDLATKISNSFLNPTNSERDSIIVYGPQGCGKTRNALAMAAAFGLRTIRDAWSPGDQLPRTNTLVLTNFDFSGEMTTGLQSVDRMSFKEAMKIVRPRQ